MALECAYRLERGPIRCGLPDSLAPSTSEHVATRLRLRTWRSASQMAVWSRQNRLDTAPDV